ncbi:MAG: hypothetical protein AAFU60_10035 [Bacteroidota bacterium]
MQKILYISLLAFLPLGILSAQTANEYLASANAAYASGNNQEARFQLQQALIALDEMLAKDILSTLPTSVEDLTADTNNDQYTSVNTGFTGLYVDRNYTGPGEKSLQISIMNDSPFLANLTSMLANPLMAGMAGMKVVRFDGYKGAVEVVEGSSPLTVNISIPFGDSLMTLEFKGVADQEEAVSITEQLPIGEVIKIAK